jgi:hypothetical protein
MNDITNIKHIIRFELDEEDFRTLCFLVVVDYDLLPGEKHKAKVEAFLNYLEGEPEIHSLLQEIPWFLEFQHKNIEPRKAELIQLHLAIIDRFNDSQINQLFKHFRMNRMVGGSRRDDVRELLISLWRGDRIPELINVCDRIQPGFPWQNYHLPVESHHPQKLVDSKKLAEALINDFNVDDLAQFCFYLGFDFENIIDHSLLRRDSDSLTDNERKHLRNSGVHVNRLTEEEFKLAIKELWASHFIYYCKRRTHSQVAAVYHYMQLSRHET